MNDEIRDSALATWDMRLMFRIKTKKKNKEKKERIRRDEILKICEFYDTYYQWIYLLVKLFSELVRLLTKNCWDNWDFLIPHEVSDIMIVIFVIYIFCFFFLFCIVSQGKWDIRDILVFALWN